MTDQLVMAKQGTGGHRLDARPNLAGKSMKALKDSFKTLSALGCLVALTTIPVGAWADDDASDAAALSAFSDSAILTSEELNSERARQKIEVEKVQINDQDLNGTVAGNTAIGNDTGHNTISGDAFSGAAGFISSVQNSGNNVLIQNSTIINVSVEP